MTVTTRPGEGALRRLADAAVSTEDSSAAHKQHALLRARVGWYLLGIDCVAFLLSTGTHWPPRAWQVFVLVEMCAFLGGVGKLYRPRLTLSLLDDVPYLAGAAFVCLLTELSLVTLTGTFETSRRCVIQMGALLALLTLGRACAYIFVRHARRTGLVRHRVLVVGAGRIGTQLVRNLQEHKEYGLDPIGYWDRHPPVSPRPDDDVPVFGADVGLSDLVRVSGVKMVIIAFSRVPESDLVDLLRTCDRLQCELHLVPRLFELQATTRGMDDVWGIPLARIHRTPFRTLSWQFKRMIDIAVAATAMILLSPVLIACAAAVRLEGGPGFIFRQERIGLDGRRLTLLKFRSLRPASDQESATTWNVSNDHRLGNVGRFLRKTSLDELPQLWNILTGEMSLVGPRPERPHFADQFATTIPRYSARHRVPVGLTGWAQVHGLRGDTSIEERAMFDNIYVENWTLWGDIKIMVRTIEQVLGRKGG